jgi:farnesyl-diphosphate farnesyltransferase
LINILRDIPRDLRQGRCYLPLEQLKSIPLTPSDLLDASIESKVRPVYDAWLNRAQNHLADGWTYTNAYPRSQGRVRISCALPVLIGRRTLDRLRRGAALDASTRIKVPRSEVKRLVIRTVLSHPFEGFWHRLGVPRVTGL